MPIKLELNVPDYSPSSGAYKMTNTMEGKEDQAFDLSFTNMNIDLSAGTPVTMTATFIVSNLKMLLDAVMLTELTGINLFLLCPKCHGKLVQYEDKNFNLMPFWKCDCTEIWKENAEAKEPVDGSNGDG